MPYNLRSQNRLVKTTFQHHGKFHPDALDYAGHFPIDEKNQVGVCEIKGKRPTQEDAIAFDKNTCINFKTLTQDEQKKILLSTFDLLQQQDAQTEATGSTACVVTSWISQDKAHLVTANLGDSTAFLVITDQLGKTVDAKRLNQLHKPTDPEERKRIETAGGFVLEDRLDGCLAVSRAFGDIRFRGISHTPDISFIEVPIEKDMRVLVVVACDGVDEALSEQQILQAIGKNSQLHPTEIANQLVMQAYHAGSYDNISVMVVPVSETCVSAAVFDGHGGSTVSKTLAEHFYKIFNQEMQAVLETSGKKKFKKLPEQSSPLQKLNFFSNTDHFNETSEHNSSEKVVLQPQSSPK